MDGLDQPSTAGAPAALPGFSRTIRQHAPRVEGVRRTSLGRALRWQDGAADLRQVDGRTHRDAGSAAVALFACCGHCFVEKSYSPIRDNIVLNLLSRLRAS